MAFLRPFPVLEISTGATNQNQGQYAFSVSGVNPEQVYDASDEAHGQADARFRAFSRCRPTITTTRRISTSTSGASRPRSTASPKRAYLTLLRNAYSQNYLYLIKKPADQYQVILEARGQRARNRRGSVAAVHQIGRRQASRAAERAGHLEVDARTPGGQSPQPVHQRHAFFNLKPGVAIGDATDFITRSRRRKSCRRRCAPSLQGEALTFRDTVRDLTILMVLAVFVMYVILAILYESYLHPLTVLSTLPTALVGGLADALSCSARRRRSTRSSACSC